MLCIHVRSFFKKMLLFYSFDKINEIFCNLFRNIFIDESHFMDNRQQMFFRNWYKKYQLLSLLSNKLFFWKIPSYCLCIKRIQFCISFIEKNTVPRKKKFFQEKWKKNHFTITIKYCIRAKKCSNIYDKYCFIIFLRTSKTMAYSIL